MEFLDKFLQPQIIGPMIGMIAVIGAFTVSAIKLHFNHQERLEKIRAGIDPDSK